jgi:hypothetical protein
MRTLVLALAVIVAVVAGGPRASADTLTVGVFAPAASFDGAAARVDLANRLAAALGKAAGADGVGRVYGRAGDFAAAVKNGEVQVALVDATYLAAAGLGNGTVIAASTHGGDTGRVWQIVARGGAKNVLALQRKKLLVPAIGGRETDFVMNAMFGGELGKGFFASITASPDTASTLAALGLGKADAALVPATAALPAGVVKVTTLLSVPGPVLVAYGTMTDARRRELATAATSFKGDSVVGGFKTADSDVVRGLAKRFATQSRKGPMAVPSVRIVVGDLVAARTLVITPGDATRYVAPVEMPR